MVREQRKKREQERKRRLILDAAKRLFVREGFDNVSLRRIARVIEYSPAALYRYFEGKREILTALRHEGFELFLEHQMRVGEVDDPLTRLRATGRNYLEFAQEQPEYFDLMFNTAPSAVELTGKFAERPLASFEHLRSIVKDCMDAGVFQSDDLEAIAFGLWSTVHGLANLVIKERVQALCPEADLDQLMERIFDFMLRPWLAQDAQGSPNTREKPLVCCCMRNGEEK